MAYLLTCNHGNKSIQFWQQITACRPKTLIPSLSYVPYSIGVPVTYEVLPSDVKSIERVPPIAADETPLDVSRKTLNNEVLKQVNSALSALEELKIAVANKRTGKALIDLITTAENRINELPSNLASNLEFANEVIQDTAKEAQTNAEAIINQRLREIGINAVGQDPQAFLHIGHKDD